MSLGRFKCKDNNAAIVKRMMPMSSGVAMHKNANSCQFYLIKIDSRSQKSLRHCD